MIFRRISIQCGYLPIHIENVPSELVSILYMWLLKTIFDLESVAVVKTETPNKMFHARPCACQVVIKRQIYFITNTFTNVSIMN